MQMMRIRNNTLFLIGIVVLFIDLFFVRLMRGTAIDIQFVSDEGYIYYLNDVIYYLGVMTSLLLIVISVYDNNNHTIQGYMVHYILYSLTAYIIAYIVNFIVDEIFIRKYLHLNQNKEVIPSIHSYYILLIGLIFGTLKVLKWSWNKSRT